MSDPIDYIDLTVDQPDQPLRLRSKGIKNNAKSRKRNFKQHSVQLQDSIIEIPVENTCKDVEPMEIIDLDKINNTEETGVCYVNNSKEEKLIVLTCPICYEQLSSKIKPMSTPCGHIYCTQCLKLALHKIKKCPTCQKTIKLQSCTRLYF
ncbi:hypothetical protein E2986_07352 [Frieseomelitta varia]|uniref:RING-type domain-containing protein n=1 Tax=Frieseomelitta varia TaxID=561572 RepID=A0A833VV93_9HYME|nr:E3 ubiquitin-protein ligase RNF4-like [Frieseomelitta varia]XP_043514525.1 E3 ubiquitin-protein ligase RNF4-like [Frieseomelitta varia]KAF3425665.1 hypothetical protein E2986_07352 [Frieseomelitta varia]